MTSYHASNPPAVADFRDNTEKQAMLGVNKIPSLSPCCKGAKTPKEWMVTR